MIYPKHIYRDFEIIEKEICGERHFAIVETKTFLFFWERKCHVYLGSFSFNGWAGYESSKGWGDIWHKYSYTCESAIKAMNEQSEYRFKRKVLN